MPTDPLLEKRNLRLSDFIDTIESGVPGNDVYMTANNHALARPELAPLLRDIGPLPEWFDPRRLASEALLWMGPRGVVTPLHHDTIHRDAERDRAGDAPLPAGRTQGRPAQQGSAAGAGS